MPIDQYRRTSKAQANAENPLPPDPIAVITSTGHLHGDIRMDTRKRIARRIPTVGIFVWRRVFPISKWRQDWGSRRGASGEGNVAGEVRSAHKDVGHSHPHIW